MPEFYAKLRFQQRLLLLLLALMLGFAILGIFSLAVLVGQLINEFSPVQEATAWLWLVGMGFGSMVLAVAGLALLALRRPRASELARLVEERNPKLKETLSTAMEIQERGGPSNSLEEALFRQVESKCAEINLKRDALPRVVHPAAVLGLIAGAMLLSDFAGDSRFVQKARFYQLDRLQGESTGLLVEPGDAEVPRNHDLGISASVTRWQKDAVIVYEQEGKRERYPMTLQAGTPATFTFFGITEPLRYRIETASLQSPWYQVDVYDPPRIDEVNISITAPVYTREESIEFNRLLDLNVPEASNIRLAISTQQDVTGQLRVSGDDQPMERIDNKLSADFVALSDGDFQIILRNAEGRQLVTPTFGITVIPDEPPVVELIEPGEDSKAKPAGAVPYSVFSGDDYGLSRVELHLSVSGLPRSPQKLFEANDEVTLEQELLGALELTQQSAEHGDIISYYAVAKDNREPDAQTARSDVFFIEVLTDIPEQEGEESEGEGEGEGERDEINLRALIVELKRLMREAHAAVPQTGERREETMQGLATGTAEVRRETVSVTEKLANFFLQQSMGDGTDPQETPQLDGDSAMVLDLMSNAINSLVEAERVANQDDPDTVTPNLAEALSNLLVVESYLRSQPQMQSSSGQGQPSEGQAQASGEPQEQKGEQGQSQQMGLDEMQKAVEELSRLIDEQSSQNADYGRADGQSLSEAEVSELMGKQTEIDQRVRLLQDQLKKQILEESYEAREALKSAKAAMRKASQATGQGDLSAASRSGMRAREDMIAAQGSLEGLMQGMASGAIAGLSQRAGQLARQQQAAQEASEQATANEQTDTKALREQQEALREQYQQFLAEMEREAVSMESVFPDAGEALGQAARNARRANTEGEMQRAANALLYERFRRAGKHQGDAAEQLEQLENAIGQAAGTLPAMSPAQLQQLAQQIAQARQEAMQGQREGQQGAEGEQAGEFEQAAQQRFSRLGEKLGEAGKALNDESLAELGQDLEASEEGDSTGLTRAELAPALDRAARIIQQYLRSEAMGERLRMNRATAPPPEQYRRLVEEYFKNLAEEPSR